MKIIFDVRKNICYAVSDSGEDRIINFKLKVEFPEGFTIEYDAWPKTVRIRKMRRDHYKKTGEILKVESKTCVS